MNCCSRGVIRVDVHLRYLDINQCSMPYYVANAFKNSDRCDYQSTVVCFVFSIEFHLVITRLV